MANTLQPVRGTRDILGEDAARHAFVVDTGKRIAALYGFAEWQTPVFEDTQVFLRPLGETSDVVTKEMYTFEDRGGDSITLRPEGTAGVCRALISNGLTQTLPQKVFYAGPMFRYERPQKGRYRQFHQIGVELLGPNVPLADAEVIACGWQILQALGVADDVVLHINTLGDTASRQQYRAALVAYFSGHRDKLSEDSRTRLEKNPLRILDSKDSGDRELIAHGPRIYDHLSAEAAAFYAGLKAQLTAFGVPFMEDPGIVRGFDYYNHTAFEFVTEALGAQGTVLGGGRYNGLVEQLGGPAVAGVGWAAGIERLAMLVASPEVLALPVAVIPMQPEFEAKSLQVLKTLRDQNIAAEIGYAGNAKKRLERANKSGAAYAVLVGAELQLKSLADGSQREVTLDTLAAGLTE
ncbi:MAG: histidine--tRNA ligase [Rhodospirillales bacterium 20-64-7]|nr:MAG: histidine--tRNA ligase [Rhodospirillales bacterium 20-64-7]